MQSFRDLKVYQKAYEYSLKVYKINFPQHENFELARQIRRASTSIALNIAEGYGKNSSLSEFKRYLAMARGSCDEVRVLLDYCRDLGYMREVEYSSLESGYQEIGKMLTSIIRNWK